MTTAKVALGKRLFADRRLSFNGTTSCLTCHRPELAFTDGKTRPVGATGDRHRRNAMSLMNSAYALQLGWSNPRTRSIERQIRNVFYNTDPIELGWTGHRDGIVKRLAEDIGLSNEFDRVFGGGGADSITEERITQALASYVRTLIAMDSAYDRWVYFDDPSGLSEAARRGMRLFFSPKAGCGSCHSGITFAGPVAIPGEPQAKGLYANTGLGGQLDQGLIEQTGQAKDSGRFRVVTLRNLSKTAPYMHDGRYPTLHDVIDHYARLNPANGRDVLDPAIVQFDPSPAQRDDLVAFLLVL
ncbi:MAG: cytochrome c peroxidase [Gammaproteobacteria bacterium]